MVCGSGGFDGKANASKNSEALVAINLMALDPFSRRRQFCGYSRTPIFNGIRRFIRDRLYGLVSEFPATDPEVPASIPDATRFSEK
jgi:hypothetical protein